MGVIAMLKRAVIFPKQLQGMKIKELRSDVN